MHADETSFREQTKSAKTYFWAFVNRAESALPGVALGRKNFLFVGSLKAGDHVAALYTLVTTCERHHSTRSSTSPTC